MTTAAATRGPAAAEILTLLASIERHGSNAPAAIAFRSALRRKGAEADALGGLPAVDSLMRAIADADPTRADARTALCRAAWADLLPDLGGKRS